MHKVERTDGLIKVIHPCELITELPAEGIGVITYLAEPEGVALVLRYELKFGDMSDLQIIASVDEAIVPAIYVDGVLKPREDGDYYKEAIVPAIYSEYFVEEPETGLN